VSRVDWKARALTAERRGVDLEKQVLAAHERMKIWFHEANLRAQANVDLRVKLAKLREKLRASK
jgi:hypothetical protein